MTIQQPVSTDTLNSPDHSLSHRVFANDNLSPVQAVVVDVSGNTYIGDYANSNYTKIARSGLMTFSGTGGIDRAYGCFSDSTTQTITGSTSLAYAMTFNTDEAKNGITHSTSVNPSRITLDTAGTYLFIVCPIVKTTLTNKQVDIWFRVDGTDVPRSNTKLVIGTAQEKVVSIPLEITVTAGQYVEVMWSSDHNGSSLPASAAQTNPTRPTTPSVILTVNKVSRS